MGHPLLCLCMIGIFFLVMIHSGTSLKCYTCKSAFNGKCDNLNVKDAATDDCDQLKLLEAYPKVGQKYVCVIHRMTQKESNTELSIVRGCAPNNYCASFPGSAECTTCNTDYCNSSASSTALSCIIVGIVSLILSVRYF